MRYVLSLLRGEKKSGKVQERENPRRNQLRGESEKRERYRGK